LRHQAGAFQPPATNNGMFHKAVQHLNKHYML
jgi:hypothetical protein